MWPVVRAALWVVLLLSWTGACSPVPAAGDDEAGVMMNGKSPTARADESSRMDLLMNGNVPNTVRVNELAVPNEEGLDVPARSRMGPLTEKILIGILSAPKNFAERQAIRESWFRYVQDDTVLSSMSAEAVASIVPLFFIGNPTGPDAEATNSAIAKESDVVRLPELMESYANLTLKTAMIMEYAFEADYDVLFKLDDDDFVRLDLFATQLAGMGDTENLYWGRLKRNVSVIHTVGQKWYEGQWKESTYPDYMLGSGYAVGKAVLRHVANSIANLTMYANEDASVGIWTKDLPLRRLRMSQMVLQPWCDRNAVVVNGVEPAEQGSLFSNACTRGDICSNDFYLRTCSKEPCKCCVDPKGNIHAQVDELCCY